MRKEKKEHWIWAMTASIIVAIILSIPIYIFLISPLQAKLTFAPFIKELPIYKNAQSVRIYYERDHLAEDIIPGGVLSFTSKDNPEKIMAYYTQELGKQSWAPSDQYGPGFFKVINGKTYRVVIRTEIAENNLTYVFIKITYKSLYY